MTETQKQLYLEIKNKIDNGDFSQACNLLEEYVLSYPAGIEGWLSYILAFCEVKSTKDLIKCDVDFTQTDIFEKALENLGGEDRSKLISLAETVSSARNKKNESSAGYSEGLQYFVINIKALKQNIEGCKTDLQSSIVEDADNFKKEKKAIKFFSNNIFVFLLTVALVMFPFLTLHLYFDLIQLPQIYKTLALATGGVVLFLVVIGKYKKYKKMKKLLLNNQEDAIANEHRIITLKKEISDGKIKYKKLLKIYKFYKKRPKLKERDVARLRTKFDNVYNGLE